MLFKHIRHIFQSSQHGKLTYRVSTLTVEWLTLSFVLLLQYVALWCTNAVMSMSLSNALEPTKDLIQMWVVLWEYYYPVIAVYTLCPKKNMW